MAERDFMIATPKTHGYIVEYETEEVSQRTGKNLWREVLLTEDKKSAEEKVKELTDKGLKARMFEGIF